MNGTWVRFRYENGRWDEPRWLGIGREWFLEIRLKLWNTWRDRYSDNTPLRMTPKAWVLARLDQWGVRLRGEDTVYLPYALYLTVQVATEGDSSTGPRGKWQILRNILPEAKKPPTDLFSTKGR